MSQADSSSAPAALAADAEAASSRRDRSWWLTLPGLLTGLAGLISAVTGLVVAIDQLRPSHAASPPQAAAASPATAALQTTPGTTPASQSSTIGGAAPTRAVALRASFPAGRHAEANGGLLYDVLSATTRAGNPGQVTFALQIRLTNPGRYDANFWASTFRLRVGADTSAPTNFLDDLVHGGTTGQAEIDFTLPASTRRAVLLVGDDSAKAVALPVTFTRSKP